MKNHHEIQMKILNELLFRPESKFTDLNIGNLSSDHLSYHLNNLLEETLIQKSPNGHYSLTPKGKEFANTFDEVTAQIEKQPKVGVLIIATRKIDGEEMFLIQKRLKEPYYGYVGFLTGKVAFGEKLEESARRELKEETNLSGEFTLLGTHHDLVYSAKNELLEDKIFFVFFAKDCTGRLLKEFKGGENFWVNKKDFKDLKNKYYNEDEILKFALDKNKFFEEKKYVIDDF